MSIYSNTETSLAMSTLAIWCRVVQSRDVRSRVFSRPKECSFEIHPPDLGTYMLDITNTAQKDHRRTQRNAAL